MNNPVKMRPIGAKPAPMSEEQKNDALMRAYMQQRNSFTQGLLFNAVQHQEPTKELVDRCIEVAEYAVEKLFGMTVTAKPAQE